jgi:hypothetical protein
MQLGQRRARLTQECKYREYQQTKAWVQGALKITCRPRAKRVARAKIFVLHTNQMNGSVCRNSNLDLEALTIPPILNTLLTNCCTVRGSPTKHAQSASGSKGLMTLSAEDAIVDIFYKPWGAAEEFKF